MPNTGKTTRGETDSRGVYTSKSGRVVDGTWWGRHRGGSVSLPYATMTLDEIGALPVRDLAAGDGCHLYLWTTNRYVEQTYGIARAWGFKPSQLLVWDKPPMGIGFGGMFTSTTEFVLLARRGSARRQNAQRHDSSWFGWSRPYENGHIAHSAKPDAFLDLVEQVSPGPYLELFARRQRLGWDTWGNEALEHVEFAS
jgi:N6-adenosine-specific RNA methylase IME4